MKYIQTINHDLHGIKKLLLFTRNENFSSVAVHSLFRDSCLMLYEIIKVLEKEGILKETPSTFKYIESIRHKVKASQGKHNRNIFNSVLNTHFDLFGKDIDNLGFYLDQNKLIGSTLYVTYVYDETPFFDSINSGEVIKEFSQEVGMNIANVIDAIEQPLLLPSKSITMSNEEVYELKDVWHKRFLTNNITMDVCIMRLLIIQNEISSCLWIEKHLDYKGKEISLDKYILLRLSLIKFYQTMESLLDLKRRAPQQYSTLNLNNLNELLLSYKYDFKAEIKTLRNLLHYSDKGINFYEYLMHSIKKDNEYADNLLQTILIDFFPIITDTISDSLNISNIVSMSDSEKIGRRVVTKVKQFSKLSK
ncbi:hypothetical protein VBD025_04505 [Virgibacillus flavescens]|uniref:hypothetical protein n=1 Tax=Virgibacillus flavescens TaxID=1611422 RepID=UPI003D32D78E